MRLLFLYDEQFLIYREGGLKLKVELLPEQRMGSNVYLLHFGRDVLLVDAGCSLSSFDSDQINICAVLCTHGHFDHIMHVDAIVENFQTQIFAHESEIPLFTSPKKNASFLINQSLSIQSPVIGFYDGQVLTSDFFSFSNESDSSWKITVIHTPGHTEGSVSYFYEDQSENPPILFSGDTVFKGTVGRTDLGGDLKELYSSIHKLAKLPEETIIYPGHGPSTTMKREKRRNPYFSDIP